MDRELFRVKLYALTTEGSWKDRGTGTIECAYVPSLGAPALVVTEDGDDSSMNNDHTHPIDENKSIEESTTPSSDHKKPNILIQSKIQCEDIYERQGESIIMWREASLDIDYALSFRDISGCLAIWDAIGEVNSHALLLPKRHVFQMYFRFKVNIFSAVTSTTMAACFQIMKVIRFIIG